VTEDIEEVVATEEEFPCCKCGTLDTKIGVIGMGDDHHITHRHYCNRCYNKEKFGLENSPKASKPKYPEWTKKGIRVTEKNKGVQLVLKKGFCIVDFWPTTEVWVPRGTGERSVGKESLTQFLLGE
jgi:hypothetical protein